MIIAAPGARIDVEQVPADVRFPHPAGAHESDYGQGSFKERKAAAERSIVLSALERNGWHITRTAAELGLADHASLLKIMRRHGLRRER
jgi:transcriptional regulator of acetoin/glycerol metabolism